MVLQYGITTIKVLAIHTNGKKWLPAVDESCPIYLLGRYFLYITYSVILHKMLLEKELSNKDLYPFLIGLEKPPTVRLCLKKKPISFCTFALLQFPTKPRLLNTLLQYSCCRCLGCAYFNFFTVYTVWQCCCHYSELLKGETNYAL